jgi:HlyD family secretion protein
MKKMFYGLLVVIVLGGIYLVTAPKEIKVESMVLHRGTFEETFSADGIIRAKNRQTVYAFATGNIENLKVKVGDTVTKGQVVTLLMWDRDLQVRSPVDGVVSKIFRESAGPIVRGEPIFEVSNLSDIEIVVDLLTPEAVRLNPKGEAKVLNWGGSNELPAKIFQISRAGVVKISALGVEEERTEVRMDFEKIPPELKDKFGDTYHVDVIFLISRVPNALTVPLGALFMSADKWAVYIIQEGRARLREIQISKKNDRAALVTEGLIEGDQVILFPGDKISEGTRVKVD